MSYNKIQSCLKFPYVREKADIVRVLEFDTLISRKHQVANFWQWSISESKTDVRSVAWAGPYYPYNRTLQLSTTCFPISLSYYFRISYIFFPDAQRRRGKTDF